MEHQYGYCDECGAELDVEAQLTVAGKVVCEWCVSAHNKAATRAGKPEARDDGR